MDQRRTTTPRVPVALHLPPRRLLDHPDSMACRVDARRWCGLQWRMSDEASLVWFALSGRRWWVPAGRFALRRSL